MFFLVLVSWCPDDSWIRVIVVVITGGWIQQQFESSHDVRFMLRISPGYNTKLSK